MADLQELIQAFPSNNYLKLNDEQRAALSLMDSASRANAMANWTGTDLSLAAQPGFFEAWSFSKNKTITDEQRTEVEEMSDEAKIIFFALTPAQSSTFWRLRPDERSVLLNNSSNDVVDSTLNKLETTDNTISEDVFNDAMTEASNAVNDLENNTTSTNLAGSTSATGGSTSDRPTS